MTWEIPPSDSRSPLEYFRSVARVREYDGIYCVHCIEYASDFARQYSFLLKALGIKYVLVHDIISWESVEKYNIRDLLLIFTELGGIPENVKMVRRTMERYRDMVKNPAQADITPPLRRRDELVYIPERNIVIVPDMTHEYDPATWLYVVSEIAKVMNKDISDVISDVLKLVKEYDKAKGYIGNMVKLLKSYPVKIMTLPRIELVVKTKYGDALVKNDGDVLTIWLLSPIEVDGITIVYNRYYLEDDDDEGDEKLEALIKGAKLRIKGLRLRYLIRDKLIFDSVGADSNRTVIVIDGDKFYHPNINGIGAVCLGTLNHTELDMRELTTTEINRVIERIVDTLRHIDATSPYNEEARDELIDYLREHKELLRPVRDWS